MILLCLVAVGVVVGVAVSAVKLGEQDNGEGGPTPAIIAAVALLVFGCAGFGIQEFRFRYKLNPDLDSKLTSPRSVGVFLISRS